MSLQLGGLCFILLCHFLAVSTNVIYENVRSEEVIIEFYRTLTLHCNATEVPGATVVWRREGSKNITLRSSGIFEFVEKDFSTIKGDPLNLTNIQRGDKGVYICTASNGVDPSVKKRFIVDVNFSPDITILQTHWHVHALLGEDATFQCHVEAKPRATNTWTSQPGTYSGEYPAITLVNSNKYVIEETQLDEQTTLMQLTVRNVEPADYLIYSCSSNNLLGGFNVDRKLRNQSIEHLL